MSDTLHPYDANRPERRASRAPNAEPAKSRVLILDDDRDSRLVCRAYCDLFDHPSQSVATLDEALGALLRGVGQAGERREVPRGVANCARGRARPPPQLGADGVASSQAPSTA